MSTYPIDIVPTVLDVPRRAAAFPALRTRAGRATASPF